MAKKASMCRYKHDAFVAYDCQVRERAGAHGMTVFAELSAEDVATFFCAENMLYSKDKSNKKSNDLYYYNIYPMKTRGYCYTSNL